MWLTQFEVCDTRKGLLHGVAYAEPNQSLLSWYEINEFENSGSAKVTSLVEHEEVISCYSDELPSHLELDFYAWGSLVTVSR